MMTSHAHICLVYLLVCFTSLVEGSATHFWASSPTIKAPVTRDLHVRCSLYDTTGQPAVGRRDVTTDNHENRAAPVHYTDSNDNLVSSIVISRDGADLATIIEHFPARAVGGATAYTVTGSITPRAREKGVLELVWPRPSASDAGNYTCDIYTRGANGGAGTHFQDKKTVAVSQDAVTIPELVTALGQLDAVTQTSQSSLTAVNTEVSVLTQQADVMKQQIANLTGENVQLRKSLPPNVFFSAVFTTPTELHTGQQLKYQLVLMNEGGGYSPSSGDFTAPVAGFYYLEIHAGSKSRVNRLSLIAKKNLGDVIMTAFTGSSDYNSASGSVYVKLDVGDKVQVFGNWPDSSLWGDGDTKKTNTFSGRLVALE